MSAPMTEQIAAMNAPRPSGTRIRSPNDWPIDTRTVTLTLGVKWWSGSPAEEVGEGEEIASEALVEPAAEVVEGDLGGEAGVIAAELVGPVELEAEGAAEAVVDGLDDLAEAAVPAAQR